MGMPGVHMGVSFAKGKLSSSHVKFRQGFSRYGGNGCPPGDELECASTARELLNQVQS